MREDIVQMLNRIKYCVEQCQHRRWGSSKKYIFQGSYDVLMDANDGPKYDQIMNDRLNEAKNLGLIVDDSNGNWSLTELGENYGY